MPVARLFVEGELDEALLAAVRPPGMPVIEIGGSKGSLAPRARDVRAKHIVACYVRDRDFDHEPPAELDRPSVDQSLKTGSVLGWRWCRHEIESYLLDPVIVSASTGWEAAAYSATLVREAQALSEYTAARWILGLHRRNVDRHRLFRTRPAWDNEIKIPDDLSSAASTAFLLETLEAWEKGLTRPSGAELCEQHHQRASTLRALGTAEAVLLWHGGKDLLAALAPEIRARYRVDPKTFRHRLRDWIRDNPASALERLPEWAALFQAIAAEP